MKAKCIRIVVDLEGVLQGVGFRPTLQRLATAAALGGWTQNRSGRVRLALEGPNDEVDAFLTALPARLPPNARLDVVSLVAREALAGADEARFRILESESDACMRISIPADLALCADCRREVLDPQSRYFGYPFTTCTSCGPRFTVVEGMPYDRERTTLRAFPLCAVCRAEYEDPLSRRFHAESIACSRCGPRLGLLDAAGKPLAADPLCAARRALAAGQVVAVRGLGGFLLAVDALDGAAVARLRERKHRPHKPLAVMARDVEVLQRWCQVPAAAARLLAGPAAPIVVLDPRPDVQPELPLGLLAPDTGTLGAMLPTTALHLLLLEPLPGDPTPPFELLVMTSGNRHAEPICTGNEEAVERLSGIADLFLCHDRDIHFRADDSVAVITSAGPQLWRRARGFAPQAVPLSRPLGRTVLAMGAELKNTIALGFDAEVVLSAHHGDLETPQALDALEQAAARLPTYLGREPQLVAVDLHPDLHATLVGERLAAARGIPVVRVQHHHAHAAACMAEHGVHEALALAFDGTGYGGDGAIWGAELLHVRPGGYERLGTFAGAPLCGADAAVLRPARQLAARFLAAGVEVSPAWRRRLGLRDAEIEAWALQCAHGTNAPITHAAGRVFDAFAAGVGEAPATVTYEGQAAVRLERLARRATGAEPDLLPLGFARHQRMIIADWSPVFRALAERVPGDSETERLALSLHWTMAEAALRMAEHGREVCGLARVALTGGVFMNRVLSALVTSRLEAAGFAVLAHAVVPPNDGGVALGQACIAGGEG